MDFIDLKQQQARISEKLSQSIQAVLDHGQYIMGPEVKSLEERLGTYVGARHAIACSSGTDALLMALMAYGVGVGDAVFTTPFTFVATAEVISLLGATPVFVDIDPETFDIDPDKLADAFVALEQKHSDASPLPVGYEKINARGVIPVDLFGQPADYDRINAIASQRGLFVIEDAAQSFGAEYHGRKVCALAEIAATSFFPAKPLGCYGDGGMVFTDDDALAQRLISIRVHGSGTNKYDNVRLGINGRLDTLQAAILLAKFEIFPEEIERRQEVANRYAELLGQSRMVKCPRVADGAKSSWAQYSLLCMHREKIMAALKARGIPSAVYYPIPLHLQGAYQYLGYQKGDFPVAERIAKAIFSLPMHPYLTEEDQRVIAETILANE
jgi:UDP-2-acetamido-2-deoxy-ribo-hexuluronate aminotransferase